MDVLPIIDLTWEGPYSFVDFLSDASLRKRFDTAGVYLWIVNHPENKRRITYIGKASGKPDLAKRQVDHFRYYISGAYFIPDWARKSKTPWNADWVNNPEITETLTHKDKLCSFVDETFAYVSLFQIYLATVSGNDVLILPSIEKSLIYEVQPVENMRGKLKKPNQQVQTRHLGSAECTTLMSAAQKHSISLRKIEPPEDIRPLE